MAEFGFSLHDEPFADINDADVEADYLALMGEAQAARAPARPGTQRAWPV